MAKKLTLLLATTAGLFGWVAGASAITITNSTLVEAEANDTSSPPVKFFSSGAGYWGADINKSGSTTFDTSSLTATYTQNGAYGYVTLTFATNFPSAGSVANGTATVEAADVFIQSAGTSSVASSFNYAISLGDTATGDGGLAAGLYSTSCAPGGTSTDCKTSMQEWGSGGKTGATGPTDYGAFFATSPITTSTGSTTCTTATSDCEEQPVVLTTGTTLSGAGSNLFSDTTTTTGGDYTIKIAALNNDAQNLLSTIFTNFNIFWGTGDNGNAPIYGEVALSIPDATPEPSSFALLATGAMGFAVLRRRRRKRSAAA